MIRIFVLTLLLFSLTACPGSSDRNSNQLGQSSAGNIDKGPNPISGGSSKEVSANQSNDKPDLSAFDGTDGKTTKENQVGSPAVLVDVRTGRHDNFDRIVFEFKGDEMPGYFIEYVGEPVTQCGSGNTVELTGDGALEIRFAPAQAHTEAGKPTFVFSNKKQNPKYPIMKKVRSTCDFEGNVTWAVGVSKKNKYRVLELKKPTRLAVDVSHQ